MWGQGSWFFSLCSFALSLPLENPTLCRESGRIFFFVPDSARCIPSCVHESYLDPHGSVLSLALVSSYLNWHFAFCLTQNLYVFIYGFS